MRILKFYTPTCSPCAALTTVLQNGGIETENINVEEHVEMNIQYNIRKVPTLVFLNSEDKEVKRLTGMATLDQITEITNEFTRD